MFVPFKRATLEDTPRPGEPLMARDCAALHRRCTGNRPPPELALDRVSCLFRLIGRKIDRWQVGDRGKPPSPAGGTAAPPEEATMPFEVTPELLDSMCDESEEADDSPPRAPAVCRPGGPCNRRRAESQRRDESADASSSAPTESRECSMKTSSKKRLAPSSRRASSSARATETTSPATAARAKGRSAEAVPPSCPRSLT